MRSLYCTTATLSCCLALVGCSSVEGFLGGDKVDYKSQASKAASLEVPPDLSQLSRDSRYQPVGGVVSASTLQGSNVSAVGTAAAVAPIALGEIRVERRGNQRWLVTKLSPEQLWPQVSTFWRERGFNLAFESVETGVMETDWAENRAKLPADGIRRTLGWLLDPLYSTGERDKFRTRIERTPDGSEIYISHRGMEEVLQAAAQGVREEIPAWRARAPDPQLEAEMLSRLMIKLGARDDAARSLVAGAAQQPARARVLVANTGAALEVDEGFDRAWRQIGLALDRSGFTVEDRDRAGGLYFVRYSDPKLAEQAEPGFFAKLFSSSADSSARDALKRYRVSVKGSGDKTQVTIQNAQGSTDKSEVAQRIAALLVDELK